MRFDALKPTEAEAPGGGRARDEVEVEHRLADLLDQRVASVRIVLLECSSFRKVANSWASEADQGRLTWPLRLDDGLLPDRDGVRRRTRRSVGNATMWRTAALGDNRKWRGSTPQCHP